MSLKNKLKRMKPHLSVPSNKEKEEQLSTNWSALSSDIPFKEVWEENDVTPYWLDQEYCLIKEIRYPLSFQQGKYRLGECKKAVEAWNKSDISHPLSTKGHTIEDLFFFDTETTGLRGVGSTIFLLGYAKFTEKEVILRQHILTQPGYEIPLYMSFLEKVDYTTLVTYNGKSFDWPQVKSRHTLIRDHVPKLPDVGHFDLYHASRRLWKHKLDSVKLTEVEEHILNFQRKDDLPGYLAPAIYFDFVERKHPEGLLKVLDHNEKDILSLISLYTHITHQLLSMDADQSSSEKVEAGKWYRSTGDHETSLSILESAYQQNSLNVSAAHSFAYALKQKGEHLQALKLWQEVVQNGSKRERREAGIEAAKLYEHKLKDIPKAIHYSQIALKAAEEDSLIKKSSKNRWIREISHRLTRLDRK